MCTHAYCTCSSVCRCVPASSCVYLQPRITVQLCMCGPEQRGCQVKKHCCSSRLCSPLIKAGGERPVLAIKHTHTHAHTHTCTFMCLSNMKHETREAVLLVYISVQFPFLSLLILFLLPVSLSPSRLFLHLLLSPLFPSLPPFFSSPSLRLITLVLYFRVGLLQS